MKVPYSWLQEFFETPLPEVERVVELLDGLGLAVEQVTHLPGAPPGVVVVDVLSVEPIENATGSLSKVIVTDGRKEHRIVCGDPSIRAGMRTALAVPGTHLPAVDLHVTSRTMLGISSEGMLASAKELGLFDHSASVIALGSDCDLGADLSTLWPKESVIELELTPNRADAFSMLGVARDLAAKLAVPCRHPAEGLDAGDPSLDDGLSLTIDDKVAAPRFTLRRVDDVRVMPSPLWMQRRLAHVGLRPRNNLVDTTNYVTFELGQPAHVYDLTTLPEGHITVRRARGGEEIELLNDERIDLDSADLLIAAGKQGETPVGLAGVMGGSYGGVVQSTTSIALEAACFHPTVVRRAGQRHKLQTDARTRFERGVDPNLTELASARLAALVEQVAGGVVHPGISAVGVDTRRNTIHFRPSRVHYLMDFDVASDVQRGYLERLGCEVREVSEDHWEVNPPSWRYDLGIEEDLIEEIARLHGYEHIGQTEPRMHFVPQASDPTHRKLKERLAALGLQEVMTYVFTGAGELERAGAPTACVQLSCPQGIEKGVLRTALFPGLLAAAALNRHAESLAFFEVGHVFGKVEEERVAIVLIGDRILGHWRPGMATDFFALKGILENLAGWEGASLETLPEPQPSLHPGVSAKVLWNGRHVGFAGQVHPEVASAYDLKNVYIAELKLPLEGKRIAFSDIVRQPFAERDLAIVVPLDMTYARLSKLLRDAAGEKLLSIAPFDDYRGPRLPPATRSLAIRFRFQDAKRALTDEQVDKLMDNIIQALKNEGYELRT